MSHPGRTLDKAESLRILRRAGYDEERLAEIAGQLPDVIDLDRDHAILERYGIGREQLMDRMGGSP